MYLHCQLQRDLNKKMVNKNSRAFIKMSPKDPAKAFGRMIKDFKIIMRDMSRVISEQALVRVKENTPVGFRLRSGRSRHTKELWTKTVNNRRDGGFTINLNNPSQVVDFLNRGTNPSPGRYLPHLNRRIRTGSHPGIQPTKFLDRTEDEVFNSVRKATEGIERKVEMSGRRHLRGKTRRI